MTETTGVPQPAAPQPQPVGPVSVEGAVASLITRAATWLFGRDSTVIVLVIAIATLCYGIRWVAIDVVPTHITTITATVSKLETEHRTEREKDSTQWREAFKAVGEQQQKSSAEAHQQAKEMLDQIERLVTGRKTTGFVSPPTTPAKEN